MSKCITDFGFVLVQRAAFFRDGPGLCCYQGATSFTAEQIAVAHAKQDVELMQRVHLIPGKWVLYCKDGDAEDFVLVGDDPEALRRECIEHEMEIRQVSA